MGRIAVNLRAFLAFVTRRKEQGHALAKKILLLYLCNRMFLWIFWSSIDSCRDPFRSKATLNVPTSHGSHVVGPAQSLIWYDRWKNQVLFLLRSFQNDATKVSWLGGQRVRPSISRCGFDSNPRCVFLSLFHRGVVTKEQLRAPLTNVFSVAEWLALLRWQCWLGFAAQIQPRFSAAGSLIKPARDHWNLAG